MGDDTALEICAGQMEDLAREGVIRPPLTAWHWLQSCKLRQQKPILPHGEQ
jgi:hypothetical protein